jgi:hypothetical protein
MVNDSKGLIIITLTLSNKQYIIFITRFIIYFYLLTQTLNYILIKNNILYNNLIYSLKY